MSLTIPVEDLSRLQVSARISQNGLPVLYLSLKAADPAELIPPSTGITVCLERCVAVDGSEWSLLMSTSFPKFSTIQEKETPGPPPAILPLESDLPPLTTFHVAPRGEGLVREPAGAVQSCAPLDAISSVAAMAYDASPATIRDISQTVDEMRVDPLPDTLAAGDRYQSGEGITATGLFSVLEEPTETVPFNANLAFAAKSTDFNPAFAAPVVSLGPMRFFGDLPLSSGSIADLQSSTSVLPIDSDASYSGTGRSQLRAVVPRFSGHVIDGNIAQTNDAEPAVHDLQTAVDAFSSVISNAYLPAAFLDDSLTILDPSHSSTSPPFSNTTHRLACLEPTCNRRFISEHTRQVHMQTHLPKRSFVCTQGCSEIFSRQHDRFRHEVMKHGLRTEWSCNTCHGFFSSEKTLISHKCSNMVRKRWKADPSASNPM